MENNPVYKAGNKGAYVEVMSDGQPEDLTVASDLFYEVDTTRGTIMENTVEYEVANEPLVIGKATMDRILQECDRPMDCIALYCFYYYTAKWQRTNKAKASVSYCAKGLKIAESRVRAAKKELIALGLTADFKRVDKKTGKVLGWYVLVKFVQFRNHPSEFPYGGEDETNALSTNSLNALNTNNNVEAKASPVENKASSIKSKKTAEQEEKKFRAAEFIALFNEATGRSFRVLNSKAQRQLNARLKEGYTMQEIANAAKNASLTDYFRQNPHYLTPEYITRADKLDLWMNAATKQATDRNVHVFTL